MKVGWIGTGVMGLPMAHHYLGAGHEIVFHSRTREKAASLEEAGAVWRDSPADVAGEVEVLCTMVGTPDDVRETYFAGTGILSGVQPRSLLIDFTTSSPSLAREIAEAAEAKQVFALDAPVSGGDVGAREASLSIMVGGSDDAFNRGLALLAVVGRTVVHQGGPGMGQHTKMMNQIVIATGMVGVCEGLVYARRAGLDLETALQSVGGGAAASWSLSNYVPRILKRDFEPGFMVEHFVKDMQIVLTECERMQLDLPGLKLAHQLYAELQELGYARKGTQSLVKVYEHRSDGDAT